MLKYYIFTDGEAKFRQDDSWAINWGNNTFPTGTATLDGPAIPVVARGYTVTFNISDGEYSFSAPRIGVIGSALLGWTDDVEMQTTDGIIYTLEHYPFVEGEVKFRLINDWEVNWGNSSFPQGIGFAYGPNIPIPCTCTYDVTFNTITGEYNFVLNDTEPPVISGIAEQLTPLWPPNHTMVPITLDYTAMDNCCGTVTNQLQIWSNEPVNGVGDGDMAPDWEIVDDHNILLRAERSGKGPGRVYTINIVSTDVSGNSSSQLVTVAVPHDQKKLKISNATASLENQNSVNMTEKDNMDINAAHRQFKVQARSNPSSGNFDLKVESLSNQTIDVYVSDILGRRLKNMKSESNQSIYFGADLQPGMYVVEVRQGNNSKIIKMIKQ